MVRSNRRSAFDVLVQIPGRGADDRAMREMLRVLKPGGVAFVRGAAYRWMKSGHDLALGTERRYDLGELREKLNRAGFEREVGRQVCRRRYVWKQQ